MCGYFPLFFIIKKHILRLSTNEIMHTIVYPLSRFESLTLSHNNMIALKPVLMAWLEEAEAARIVLYIYLLMSKLSFT